MSEENVDLRACPFCGSGLVEPVDDGLVYWVECMDCAAEGPVTHGAKSAARLWNARTPSLPDTSTKETK
jgi:Lar family restriction alleviation protein